jgi:hypothetical protein
MRFSPPPRSRRRGRTLAAVIAYLIGFTILLFLVLHFFFVPAAKVATVASRLQRKRLAALSWLMLTVLLFYLLAGLMLVFRIGRFFFPPPGPGERRTRTPHVDIWAEAGKRFGEKSDKDEE